ncbi:MAG: PEP-CTERM sorting domain-containing protein [Gemmatimonadaceae bacterium]
MKKLNFMLTAVLVAATAIPSMVSAQVACTAGFGSAPSTTFGGSGIPNSAVSYNNCVRGLSLNLTAHQRYDNPAVTNNGAGTFTAQAGQDANTVSPQAGYAKWNFGYDIQGANAGQYSYRLYFDNDPQTGNALDGFLNIPGSFGAPYANSLNLGMSYLNFGIFGPAPTYQPFSADAAGQYGFDLVAYDSGLTEVARTSMLVNTSSVVPEPSTYALMAAGLMLVGAAARRKKLLS